MVKNLFDYRRECGDSDPLINGVGTKRDNYRLMLLRHREKERERERALYDRQLLVQFVTALSRMQ